MSYGNYPDLSCVRRVLVIKLRHLGDVLLSSPLISCLKQALPSAQIDAYIWKEAAPMLEGHPAIGEMFLYDRKWKKLSFGRRLSKELKLLDQIRKQKYDLIINLTEGDRGAIAAYVSGAPIKVGIRSGNKRMQSVFTHLVKPCPNPRHTVERDLDALRRIGVFPKVEQRKLVFHVPAAAKEIVETLIGTETFVLIHPGSRWRFKCLPPELVAQVIDQLEEKVVLTGGPSEWGFAEEICKHAKSSVTNLAGRTTLKEVGALMLRAKGVITVDSVSLHMASALQVPVVALFGPTSEQNWGPWQNPRSIVVAKKLSCRPCRLDGCGGSKMSDCLWTLSPKEIVEAFRRVTGHGLGQDAGALSLCSDC